MEALEVAAAVGLRCVEVDEASALAGLADDALARRRLKEAALNGDWQLVAAIKVPCLLSHTPGWQSLAALPCQRFDQHRGVTASWQSKRQ